MLVFVAFPNVVKSFETDNLKNMTNEVMSCPMSWIAPQLIEWTAWRHVLYILYAHHNNNDNTK